MNMRDYLYWQYFIERLREFLKYGYRSGLHPRKDYQRQAYWLRIRSNPFRPEYH